MLDKPLILSIFVLKTGKCMIRQNRDKILLSLVAFVFTATVSLGIFKKEKAEKINAGIEKTVGVLEQENNTMIKLNKTYDKDLKIGMAQAENYEKENPSSDNMLLLYKRIQKVNESLTEKRDGLYKDFLKKISKQADKFCKNNTKHNINECMQILHDNSEKVSGIQELDAEYKKIREFSDFAVDFRYFVGGSFQRYLKQYDEQTEFVSSVPNKSVDVIFPGGNVLTQQAPQGQYVPGNIPPYNCEDNIKQNEVINLTKLYFAELNISYADFMDKTFIERYYHALDLMLQIQELNNLEEKVESTRIAIEDLNKKISANNDRINSLKAQIR